MDISKFVGVPFKLLGRDFTGCDCWGLVYLFYKDVLGIKLNSYSDCYDNLENKNEIKTLIYAGSKYWEKVSKLEKFDLILFKITGLPIHIGIYLGENRFLHSQEFSNSCIQKLNDISWRNRVHAFYRFTDF